MVSVSLYEVYKVRFKAQIPASYLEGGSSRTWVWNPKLRIHPLPIIKSLPFRMSTHSLVVSVGPEKPWGHEDSYSPGGETSKSKKNPADGEGGAVCFCAELGPGDGAGEISKFDPGEYKERLRGDLSWQRSIRVGN